MYVDIKDLPFGTVNSYKNSLIVCFVNGECKELFPPFITKETNHLTPEASQDLKFFKVQELIDFITTIHHETPISGIDLCKDIYQLNDEDKKLLRLAMSELGIGCIWSNPTSKEIIN